MTYQATLQRIRTPGGPMNQMKETLRQIGSAIQRASVYPPIRNYAAAIASTAPPKDFLGQLRAVYDDFTRRWRYVKDPRSRELLTASPAAIWRLTMAGDGVGVGAGYGAGDCDCVATALGAVMEAIGFPVRLGTTAPPNARPGRIFGHVFIQAKCPKIGWITLDPVLYPKRPFGSTAYHSRIAYWDLKGNLLGYGGNVAGQLGDNNDEEDDMNGLSIDNWPGYGFGADDDPWESANPEPADWSTVGLQGWGWMPGGQSAVGMYGYIDGSMLGGMCAEVDEDEDLGAGYVRTPMLMFGEEDFQYIQQNGAPYPGMIALGDAGEIYQYDGLGGFFKKLFRKVKRGVKKVAKKIGRGIKKVLKKTKFGRWLIKIGGKIKKIAMKIVKPLAKFIGKWAGKLAPIAAMIPGYGTAIAAALTAAGRVAKVMNKFMAKTKKRKGSKVHGLKLKNPKKLASMQRAMQAEAKKMVQLRKRNPRQYQALLAKAKRMGR